MLRNLLIAVLLGSVALCALLAMPAQAQSWSDPDYLFGYDIVISDNGTWYEGWENSAQRVYAQVEDRGRSRDYYFGDIASAFFVLREKHGDPIRMLDLQVADYAAERSGRGGQRLLDGRRAWYFWDEERMARGGMPLILAFHSERDARALERSRYGRVLSFAAMTRELRDWLDDYGDRCYWRGSHSWSAHNWNRAWNRRWDGWSMDLDYGWSSRRHRADTRPVVIPHPPTYRSQRYNDDWQEREWRERDRQERERYERERREQERYEREQRERERREREDRERRERERREREERERREREERARREREKQIEEAPPKGIQPVP